MEDEVFIGIVDEMALGKRKMRGNECVSAERRGLLL
jgi:hypothetical protein